MPGYRRFGPVDENDDGRRALEMTVDEFEAVRLIDLEGFSQEECANHMGVARTTAQAIYGSARVKMAECLVKGIDLSIGGGAYILSEEGVPGCKCGHCCKRSYRCGNNNSIDDDYKTGKYDAQAGERSSSMKIAVTYENGEVFQHFGHTGQFKVYDIENSEVKRAAIIDTNGSGHGALADMLEKLNVDTLICGGIGAGAKRALAEAGIRLFGGVAENADKAVESLLHGELKYDSDAECDHHGEDHGEDCGQHGCGGHHAHDER
jgi:predicted DNA-binding protein (UPF0251 family)/predicted Fe-Mo cluster-binding NifX family protein